MCSIHDPIRIGIIRCGQVTRAGHGPAIRSDRRAVIITDYDGEWAAAIENDALAVLWTLAGFKAAKEGRKIFNDEVHLWLL